MEKGWVKAFETTLPYMADMVLAMLTDNEIEAVILNKQDSAILAIGKQEVYVPEEKLLRALQLINNDNAATEAGTEEEE
jgi:type III secretory pathway lipoprotein EscJ